MALFHRRVQRPAADFDSRQMPPQMGGASRSGVLPAYMQKDALAEALTKIRCKIAIPGYPSAHINYLSAYDWWPGCEQEAQSQRRKARSYDLLVGIWTTDVAPWLAGAIGTNADNKYATAKDITEAMRLKHEEMNRRVFAADEPMHQPDKSYFPRGEFIHRYDAAMTRAIEGMKARFPGAFDSSLRPVQLTESLWGFTLFDDQTRNTAVYMQQNGLINEDAVIDSVSREIAARLAMICSIVQTREITDMTMIIQEAPHSNQVVQMFLLVTATTVIEGCGGADRALLVDVLAGEKNARQAYKRMLDLGLMVMEAPSLDLPHNQARLCLHELIRFERVNYCIWCGQELQQLIDPDAPVVERPSLQEEREMAEMEAAIDERNAALPIQHGETQFEGAQQAEEQKKLFMDMYERAADDYQRFSDVGDYQRSAEAGQTMGELGRSLLEILEFYRQKNPGEFADFDSLHQESATWEQLGDGLHFWLYSKNLTDVPPPIKGKRKILRIKHNQFQQAQAFIEEVE